MLLVFYSIFLFFLNASEWNEAFKIDYSSLIFDEDNKLLRVTLSHDDKYRIKTELSDIPQSVRDAALLKEDRFFYSHPGINPISILRSAFSTMMGTRRYGASTISMQLARLIFKLKTNRLNGKIDQMVGALYLEIRLTKAEILNLYLNLIPMGSNIEGIGAGSLIYFKKEPKNLNIFESIALLEIPQHPNKKRLTKNKLWKIPHQVLALWTDYFPKEEMLLRDKDLYLKSFDQKDLPFKAPHFTDYIIAKTPNERVIKTSLNLNLQKIIEIQMSRYLKSKKSLGVTNASALLIHTKTGDIKSMVGSADYFDPQIFGQVNGTLAKRSPGSTLKPLVYALAADQGLIHSHTLLYDIPQSFGLFDPENSDQKYSGPISTQDALNRSRNVPAVFLNNKLKSPDLYDLLLKSSVTRLKDSEHYGHSITLGGAELTMLELSLLYRTLISGKIGDEQVISPESSSLVYEMMTKNFLDQNYSYLKWIKDDLKIAWKTGTSHGFRDAWSIGFVGPYILAVWLGNFDGSGNPAFIGRDLAAPLFFDIINAFKSYGLKELSYPTIVSSGQLKEEKVCSLSGDLPSPSCPFTTKALFIPGKSSIKICDIHRKIIVDQATGLRSCLPHRPHREKVYEFWPTQILELLAKSGFKRKTAPDFLPQCKSEQFFVLGRAPHFISPRPSVKYVVNSLAKKTQILPFKVNAEGDVKELFWFVGKDFVGSSRSDESFQWALKLGKHQIKVVDDHGRFNQTEIEVFYQ